MSKKREAIVDAAMDENLLFLDGYDKCIIGLGGRINCGPVVVYDGDAIVKILAKDMTLDEAEEFYSFNIEGAWVGDKTPILVRNVRR